MVINKTIAGIFHIARAFLHRGKRVFFFSKSRFYGATFQKGGSLDTWIYSKRYTYIICIQLGWFVGSTGLISHWLLGKTPRNLHPALPSSCQFLAMVIPVGHISAAERACAFGSLKGFYLERKVEPKKTTLKPAGKICHMPFVFCCKACGSFSCISCILIPCW